LFCYALYAGFLQHIARNQSPRTNNNIDYNYHCYDKNNDNYYHHYNDKENHHNDETYYYQTHHDPTRAFVHDDPYAQHATGGPYPICADHRAVP